MIPPFLRLTFIKFSELPQNSAKELCFSLQSNRHGNLALLAGLGGAMWETKGML